jgi:hypothetical protein
MLLMGLAVLVCVAPLAACGLAGETLQPRSGSTGPDRTDATVRPIVVHPADDPCAKQGVGCVGAPLLMSERVFATSAATAARAAGSL